MWEMGGQLGLLLSARWLTTQDDIEAPVTPQDDFKSNSRANSNLPTHSSVFFSVVDSRPQDRAPGGSGGDRVALLACN